MSATELARFIGIQSGVNSSEDNIRAAGASQRPKFVAAQSIRRMDADANNVARRDGFGIKGSEGFIDERGIAKAFWGCCGEYIEPTGSDYRRTKSYLTRIDQVNTHGLTFQISGLANVLPLFLQRAGNRLDAAVRPTLPSSVGLTPCTAWLIS